MVKRGSFQPLFIITAALFLLVQTYSCTQTSYPAAPQNGTDIVIDTASLEPDMPKFYSYHYQDKSISYFALKLDGKVLAFLDGCASCYAHKKGYRFSEGEVVCKYCNIRFPIYKLEKGLGNCYPIKIEGRMKNGRYVIPVALIEAEAARF